MSLAIASRLSIARAAPENIETANDRITSNPKHNKFPLMTETENTLPETIVAAMPVIDSIGHDDYSGTTAVITGNQVRDQNAPHDHHSFRFKLTD